MTCLMNYDSPEELAELQSPLLEARVRVEREQIAAVHDRRAWGAGSAARRSVERHAGRACCRTA